MKKNPFYGMSAAAMLFGCYMVNHALRIEPGQAERLLVLIGVLQLYEALLVALGVFLVATQRAPRDGVTVLLLETLFLMDATLLATECVTAEVGLGVVCALVLAALGLAKLVVVRRVAPRLLPASTAWLLGLQAVTVLAVPTAAALLALARAFDAKALFAFWWITLALPVVRQALLRTAPTRTHPSRALAVWSWVPAGSVLLHLWSVGWIHQIGFHPAYLAPFVLGLALTAGPRDVNRHVLAPALAVLLSVCQGDDLGVVLPVLGDLSPFRLAGVAAAATWVVLAYRHRHPWLLALAAASSLAGVAEPAISRILAAAGALGRWMARGLPRGPLAWGVSGIVAAFVLLGLGTWRSLGGGGLPRLTTARRLRLPGGTVTLALLLAALAGGVLLSALDGPHFDLSRQRVLVARAGWLALLAAGFSLWALLHPSPKGVRAEARPTATLWFVASWSGIVFFSSVISADSHRVPRNESRTIADIRALVAAQAAYQSLNHGHADGNLSCLAQPAMCLPDHGDHEVAVLDGEIAALGPRYGYRRSFHPGLPPEGLRLEGSLSSVRTWAYLATPAEPGVTGVRSFCGDSSGRICFTLARDLPSLRADGTCDVDRCTTLE
jgi:hypothetical protein